MSVQVCQTAAFTDLLQPHLDHDPHFHSGLQYSSTPSAAGFSQAKFLSASIGVVSM